MINIKKWGLYALLAVALSITGVGLQSCTTSQQGLVYKSLYTVEHVTSDTFDGYTDAVIKGVVTTNNMPKIGKAFNLFQAHYMVALDLAQANTNALAPSSLLLESQDLINAINLDLNVNKKAK